MTSSSRSTRSSYAVVTPSPNNGLSSRSSSRWRYLNWNGLFWWIPGLFVCSRARPGRRGLWAALTVYPRSVRRLADRRAAQARRPASAAFHGRRRTCRAALIDEPSTFSFPSGDAALAFGAAVALGHVAPAWRVPALLFGVAVAFERVAVGVHYPFDVLGGIPSASISGLTRAVRRRSCCGAATAVARVRRAAHALGSRVVRALRGLSRAAHPDGVGLLDLLERDPRFRSFTFDGHTIWAEDYLEKRPDDRPRVEALVRAERLFIGPWYVLADNLLVSGESLLRNFQEGLRVSATFGRAMRVGYVADPFGHPAQTPQLLRGFGYSSYVFSRGVGDEGERVGAEFRWQAPSGDRVLATHLVDHYSGGLQLVGDLSETAPELRARLRSRVGRMFDVTTGVRERLALLLMVGDDHVDAYARLPEAVRAIRELFPSIDARISSLEEYEAAMAQPRGTGRR